MPIQKLSRQHLSILGLFAATLAWGAGFILVKEAVLEVGLWPTLWWRFALAVVVLGILFPKRLFKTSVATVWRGAALGLFLFIGIWAQSKGLQTTSASRSGFITALYVPLTPLVAWIFFRQLVSVKQVFVALVAVCGLYIMTSHSLSDLNPFSWWATLNPGDLWTLLTAFDFAIHIVLTEKLTRQVPDSIALGLWQFVSCMVFIAVCVLFQGALPLENWNVLTWSQNTYVCLFSTVLLSTCFGFTMQIVAQKHVDSLKAALIFALEAPIASTFAFLWAGEMMSLTESVGAITVFLTSIIPEGWLKRSNGTL